MVTRVIHDLLDDTDDSPGAREHTIALDGPSRIIDLTDANYEKLAELMEPFMSASRPTPKGGKRTARTFSRPAAPVAAPTASNGNGNGNGASHAKPASGRKEFLAKAREWAKQNGHEVRDRGRVPAEILAAYDKNVRAKAREAKAAAKLAPAESVADPFATPPAPKATRSKKPAVSEILEVLKQTKDFKAVAEHFKVSVPTATKWCKDAQNELDPVS